MQPGRMQLSFAFRGAIEVPGILLPVLISCIFFAQSVVYGQAQSMTSSTRPDEFDTADHRGGQIGGMRMGLNYKLATMRCGSGRVMVGANIRRREAINYVQITCATPSCANGSCSWSSPLQGMSAGSPTAGDAHPAMMCRSNEILSGIRGRVLVFAERAGFDYAADMEIECSRITSPAVTGPSGQQFYPVSLEGSTGSWHHPDGGFSSAPPGAREVVENYLTGPISCGPRGYGATAVSVGVSSFFEGQPAVQAISLYCPRIAPTAPQQRITDTASTAGKKQKSGVASSASELSALDFGSTAGSNSGSTARSISDPKQKSDIASTASQQRLRLATVASASPNNFRLMTPEDFMWANKDYAGTLGYFAGKSNALSSCHGFIGEMGVATPGANLCGSAFMQNLSHLPAGTSHQLGDIAIVEGRSGKAPVNWHSAIFIGCNLYLQRNGGSDIQVVGQNYIDSFTSNEQVYYVRPVGLGTFTAKLAALKAEINPSEGTTLAYQAKITQIKGCFPN